jgi:hypothetical protein
MNPLARMISRAPTRAALTGAALTGAALTGAALTRAALTRAALTRAALTGAALAGTAALVTACGTGASPATVATTTVTASASATASTPPAGGTTAPVAAPPSATAAPGCSARYLHGGIGASQGAAGSVYTEIVFKNLNNVSCTMYGFPGVSVSEGLPIKLVGATAEENSGSARELVTLPPHGYASALLQVAEAGNFAPGQCHAVTVHWLQVIPPNQVAGLYIPFTTQTCLDKATATMTISAVRPGKGSNS